jgi:hypothetical protein
MKKLILTCALLTSVSLLSFGQNANSNQNAAPATSRAQGPSVEKIAEMKANRYKQQLALNDEQYKKVYEAELEFLKADQSFRSGGQTVPPGPAQQMQMTHDQKFQQALTPEQYTKYSQMKATRPGAQSAPVQAH